MEAHENQYGPVATRMIFENHDIRVWEMDLAPGEVCGLHQHRLDYVLYILSGAEIGVESPGRKPYSFPVQARATYFVPAGGVESAHNAGATRFFEALFEFKRPPKPGRERLGFVGCEAVAGKEPEPGSITILENDRVRVAELTLAPGGKSDARDSSHDTVIYVVEGGSVRIVERNCDGEERACEEMLTPGCVIWCPQGSSRGFINIGTGRFRQVTVELK